jgi:hypothetical protein
LDIAFASAVPRLEEIFRFAVADGLRLSPKGVGAGFAAGIGRVSRKTSRAEFCATNAGPSGKDLGSTNPPEVGRKKSQQRLQFANGSGRQFATCIDLRATFFRHRLGNADFPRNGGRQFGGTPRAKKVEMTHAGSIQRRGANRPAHLDFAHERLQFNF